MRRPGRTARQAQYDREQRGLLRLRRAAVQIAEYIDEGRQDEDEAVFLQTQLSAAACAYSNALTKRERRRLAK